MCMYVHMYLSVNPFSFAYTPIKHLFPPLHSTILVIINNTILLHSLVKYHLIWSTWSLLFYTWSSFHCQNTLVLWFSSLLTQSFSVHGFLLFSFAICLLGNWRDRLSVLQCLPEPGFCRLQALSASQVPSCSVSVTCWLRLGDGRFMKEARNVRSSFSLWC